MYSNPIDIENFIIVFFFFLSNKLWYIIKVVSTMDHIKMIYQLWFISCELFCLITLVNGEQIEAVGLWQYI